MTRHYYSNSLFRSALEIKIKEGKKKTRKDKRNTIILLYTRLQLLKESDGGKYEIVNVGR